MAETGKKMGDYTPLESNKKEYFFGEGEGMCSGDNNKNGQYSVRLVKDSA